MREIDELCSLIKSDPKSLIIIDWADETNEFDIQRMHDLVLKLNDIDLIDSVIKLITAEWDLLESQDDLRCYKLSDKGVYVRKFPLRNIYFCEPISPLDPFINFSSMEQTLAGVLFLCKREALSKIIPLMKQQNLKKQLLEKYSQPDEQNHNNTNRIMTYPAPVILTFFDNKLYSTAEEQQNLRDVLQAEMINIDTANGREWFAFYATYRYVKGLVSSKKDYVDFFSDIEKLLPNALPKLNSDEQGDKRYKHYTLQLGKEVDKWYVDGDKLPPINSLMWADYHFGCSEKVFKKLSIIIKRLFQRLHSLEENLSSEKGVTS